MTIGAISPISITPAGYMSGLDMDMQTSIIAGADTNLGGLIMNTGQNTDQGNLSGANILSLSPSQNSVSGLLSSISGGGISLPGLAVPATGLGNSLEIGVTSLLNAITTIPEIPIPEEKIEKSKEVKRVMPSTGYNPHATTEEMIAEIHAIRDEAVALVGGNVDIVA